jgi:glycosyltransferase involved in cell wall biosynthesis
MTKKVIFKGYFEGSSGYIQASKRYPIASQLCGFETKIMPLGEMAPDNPLNGMIVRNPKELENSLVILHQIPTVSPQEKGYFTVTEFNICPPEWWWSLLQSELILTQSRFCKDTFSKIEGIDKSKIHVVYYPMPSYCVEKGKDIREKLGLKQDTFVIGSCFEWVARKKPELMWQAFNEEFDKNENILFLNKMSIPMGLRDWQLRFNKWHQKDPRITFLQGFIEDMGEFYRGLDCYCSPTAGEGWGATLSEAMACGIPTIGSRNSGCVEFMNDKNSWLVECDPWSFVGEDSENKLPDFLLHNYQQWRLPKVDAIRKAMREVYNIWLSKATNTRAEQGLKLQEVCGMKNISAQMNKALVNHL